MRQRAYPPGRESPLLWERSPFRLSSPATPASGPDAELSTAAVTKGGDARTGHYDVVANWWKAAPDHDEEWSWGQVAGVAVDTTDRILAVTRGDWPTNRRAPRNGQLRRTNFIVVADGDGNIVEQWSQWDSILTLPHQIYISPYDPERHVWVIDSGGARRPSSGLEVQQRRQRDGDAARRYGPRHDPSRGASEPEPRALYLRLAVQARLPPRRQLPAGGRLLEFARHSSTPRTANSSASSAASGTGRASSISSTASPSTATAASTSATGRTIASRSSPRMASSSRSGPISTTPSTSTSTRMIGSG